MLMLKTLYLLVNRGIFYLPVTSVFEKRQPAILSSSVLLFLYVFLLGIILLKQIISILMKNGFNASPISFPI